ncbi:hypothetical protein DYST_00200 [Dyella terrae]|nr:hypothetical protein DYST_00200 [Dyella terrae]
MPPPRWKCTHWPREVVPSPGAVRRGFLSFRTGRGRSAAPGFHVHGKTAPSPPSARRRRGERATTLRAVRQSAPAGAGKVSMAPRRHGQGLGLRPGLLRQVVQKRAVFDAGGSPPLRHEGRFTDTLARPCFMELPRHASRTEPQVAAGAFSLSPLSLQLALPASGHKPMKPSCGDAESALSPFGSGRPVRPWSVVNPGEGTAAPWASWPQPSSENNFPAATRLPRGTNCFRFQVLHGVAPAARCGQPIPRRPDHNKDALARPCSTRKEKHHG